MDIVDSQVHLGPNGVAEMVAAMDALGICSVLIDEWWKGALSDPGYIVGDGAIRTSSPTAELAAWTYPGRFAYLVRVYPDDPEHRAVIRFARDATHARALRVSPGISRAELTGFAEGSYDGIFAKASDCGLPVFVTIPGNTAMLERYALRFPGCRIILCHCGMPPSAEQWPMVARWECLPDSETYWRGLSEQPKELAFDTVLQAARWPNVALKWAHAPAHFNAKGYPNSATRPFLRKALDAFGPERVMWASDFTSNQTGETWAELMFAVVENPELNDREREWILGKAARKWLAWQ
jgi:predicted TIM-barrel fold metal-dependent hydrolase